MDQVISVGIGQLAVARPPLRLAAVGIGSCVAVALRDRETGIGGMAHIMLPRLPRRPAEGINRRKYADAALEMMLAEIDRLGGGRRLLGARIVGGASMFGETGPGGTGSIGRRNVAAVRQVLRALGIVIEAEDVGGDFGRSVELALSDGTLRVRSMRRGSWVVGGEER